MAVVQTGKGITIRKWRAGEPLDHRKMNQVVDAVNAMVQGANPPQQVLPKPGDVPPLVVQRMAISAIAGDYLICNPFVGSVPDTASEILVAKPPELRRSVTERADLTFTYSGDQERLAFNEDAEEENQIVVPLYIEGDVIFAMNSIVGGSGVSDLDGTDLGWQDMNVAGRAWAKNDEA